MDLLPIYRLQGKTLDKLHYKLVPMSQERNLEQINFLCVYLTCITAKGTKEVIHIGLYTHR